jgi:transposase
VGYDAGKQVKGRKIHTLVDSEGLPMRVVVHSAAIQDRDGAGLVLGKIRRLFPWLELIWADGGYNAWQVEAAVAKVPPLRIEIVKRGDDMRGFVVLPRRWVVERTFSWFGRNRRLAKDFENLAETLGHLRDPRLHPACSQAARQGVGRELNKPPVWQCTITKVGKWGGKGTFAEACGNDEVAPMPDARRGGVPLIGPAP